MLKSEHEREWARAQDVFIGEPLKPNKSALSPERHPQRDFFIADIFDASLKDDVASMEHPLYALKVGDRRIRHYERNGIHIEVQPSVKGLATIADKDIWIYCISQLVEAMNRGREDVGRTVRFTAYDFLVTTNRQTSGQGYRLMSDALERLAGTRIITNIKTADKRERAGFGLIDSWHVIERDGDDRMVGVEVELPRWLWRSIEAKQVLTLSRDYFRIRKPLDKRIYEIVRKHCGLQASWRISLANLYEKSGSTASLKEFRRSIRQLAESSDLPDYLVRLLSDEDMVVFYSKGPKGAKAMMSDYLF